MVCVCVFQKYLVITNIASISLYPDFHVIEVGAKASIQLDSLKVKPSGKRL